MVQQYQSVRRPAPDGILAGAKCPNCRNPLPHQEPAETAETPRGSETRKRPAERAERAETYREAENTGFSATSGPAETGENRRKPQPACGRRPARCWASR